MARNCRFAVAVHVCTTLALHRDNPVTSDWIANSVNTNPVVVRRILSALSKAGLVRSQRGIAGGSMLSRDPEAITLKDLYLAVDEGDNLSTHNTPPNPACPVGAHIVPVLMDVLNRAEQALQHELETIHLAQVVAEIRSRAGLAPGEPACKDA